MQSCNLTYLERGEINIELANDQHAEYCRILESLGCQVDVLPADDALPDCAFIEDTAVVLDEVATIGRPHSSRLPEVEATSKELKKYRKIAHITSPGKLEGGDVLRVDRTLFVGLSSRTNLEGIKQFQKIIEPLDYQLVIVPVKGCLHLKTACTALDHQTFLIHSDWVDPTSLQTFGELLEIPESEPFAANTLRVGDSILVSSSTPRTAELLINKYQVVTIDISEFSKAEAGVTCLSLIFQNQL